MAYFSKSGAVRELNAFPGGGAVFGCPANSPIQLTVRTVGDSTLVRQPRRFAHEGPPFVPKGSAKGSFHHGLLEGSQSQMLPVCFTLVWNLDK